MKQDENEEDHMTLGALIAGGSGGQSSMQTLLTNIQGLLKVAADNARLQEKHKSFEIGMLMLLPQLFQ